MDFRHHPGALRTCVVALARPLARSHPRSVAVLRPDALDRLDTGQRARSVHACHDRDLGAANASAISRFPSRKFARCCTRINFDKLFVECRPRTRIARATGRIRQSVSAPRQRITARQGFCQRARIAALFARENAYTRRRAGLVKCRHDDRACRRCPGSARRTRRIHRSFRLHHRIPCRRNLLQHAYRWRLHRCVHRDGSSLSTRLLVAATPFYTFYDVWDCNRRRLRVGRQLRADCLCRSIAFDARRRCGMGMGGRPPNYRHCFESCPVGSCSADDWHDSCRCCQRFHGWGPIRGLFSHASRKAAFRPISSSRRTEVIAFYRCTPVCRYISGKRFQYSQTSNTDFFLRCDRPMERAC